MNKKNLTPLRAIRKKCLDCSGESTITVKNCCIPDCPLFPYRLGKSPFVKKRQIATAEKERLLMRLSMANAALKNRKEKNENT